MDDIYGIRRANFAKLLAGPLLASLAKEVERADRLGFGPSMWSQLKNQGYKIGDPVARKIEEQLGLEYGWMDQASHPGTGSHLARIDPTKLAESIAALRQVSEDMGWPYDPVINATETALAYELRCSMPAAPVMADVINFGQRVAEILRKRGGSDGGPSDGGQAGGADQKRPRRSTATQG